MGPYDVSRLNASTTNFARRVVRRLICRGPRFRGYARSDGQLTLLTVDYHCREDVCRLVKSFRRFVSPTWPVVVVANSGLPRRLPGARVVGVGRNLLHGIGLDFGMRFVSSEYVLICDPDSIIVGDMWAQIKPRVDAYGIASIDNGAPWYHPICIAFRTETWKENPLSFQHNWERGFDVAGELTAHFGGLEERALLPRTRGAGPPLLSDRPGKFHHVAEVYADSFSNMIGGSRVLFGQEAFGNHEGDIRWIRGYQDRWRSWADAYLADEATLDGFPS
jgi:hypothetical protein